MTTHDTPPGPARPPIRLWPGIVIAALVLITGYLIPLVLPDAEWLDWPVAILGIFASMFGTLAIVVWWMLFSRAPWSDRVLGVLVAAVGVLVTLRLVHESIAGASMGLLLYVRAVPLVGVALVGWAVATRGLTSGARRVALVATIAAACAPWIALRTAGTIGAGSEFHWRWTPTPEEQLLARGDEIPEPVAPAPTPTEPSAPAPTAQTPGHDAAIGASPAPGAATGAPPTPVNAAVGTSGRSPATGGARETGTPAPAARESDHTRVEAPAAGARDRRRVEWPGFRGPNRDGVVRGVQIETDWAQSPPAELWRRPIGPGWSSFAVRGDLLYTQEQRGDDEIVSCYRVSTGEPVWGHRNPARFWESNAGPGPRGTPTLSDSIVYAFGATGILSALEALTGRLVWSRDVAADTGRRIPEWGFSSSPLVVHDVVIVAAAGTLAAYDVASGAPRWRGPSYGGSYSSPHLATLDGVVQIVLLGGPGVISVAPADGTVLWTHAWVPGPIVQPALTGDGDLLVNAIVSTGGVGTRRLAVARGSNGWTVEERWTSNGLKPYFNDFVVHEGHAYGFDGSILAAIDLTSGARKWKGGRFGNGQMILLADQDALLVLSEEGELALVGAAPDKFTELARAPALDGKTWNHPVLVGDILLVRNGQEMAAFRMPTRAAETR